MLREGRWRRPNQSLSLVIYREISKSAQARPHVSTEHHLLRIHREMCNRRGKNTQYFAIEAIIKEVCIDRINIESNVDAEEGENGKQSHFVRVPNRGRAPKNASNRMDQSSKLMADLQRARKKIRERSDVSLGRRRRSFRPRRCAQDVIGAHSGPRSSPTPSANQAFANFSLRSLPWAS